VFLHLQQIAALLIAQAPPADGRPQGCIENNALLLPAIMMAILYFVFFRPQSKERKEHQKMLEALKRGDEVVTNSGIFGTVADIVDKTVTLEIAKGVKVRFLKSAIAKRAEDLKAAAAKTDAKADGAKPPAPESKESKASKT
jgi:preprotein translocase subunit YajC